MHEWNAVVDALNDLYGWLTGGQQDIFVNEIYGRVGHFSENLLVQGRPVLKDGDPITIQQFYDTAVDQIAQAIDKSKTTQLLETYAPRLAPIEEYVREIKNVVVRININEYGGVGVRIAEPLDEYGRVLVSVPLELLEEFKPVWARGSLEAENNVNGFYVTLYKGGRPNVSLYYKVGGPATIYLKGSIDGMNWRVLETIKTIDAEERAIAFTAVAYPYVMVETPTTGIYVEFELVASR
jgi:hypothetical protein